MKITKKSHKKSQLLSILQQSRELQLDTYVSYQGGKSLSWHAIEKPQTKKIKTKDKKSKHSIFTGMKCLVKPFYIFTDSMDIRK